MRRDATLGLQQLLLLLQRMQAVCLSVCRPVIVPPLRARNGRRFARKLMSDEIYRR